MPPVAAVADQPPPRALMLVATEAIVVYGDVVVHVTVSVVRVPEAVRESVRPVYVNLSKSASPVVWKTTAASWFALEVFVIVSAAVRPVAHRVTDTTGNRASLAVAGSPRSWRLPSGTTISQNACCANGRLPQKRMISREAAVMSDARIAVCSSVSVTPPAASRLVTYGPVTRS